MNNIIPLFVLIIIVAVIFLLVRIFKSSTTYTSIEYDNSELNNSEEAANELDYNEIFIESVTENDKVIRFLKIYNSIDLAFIQSLLYSSGIYSLAERTHLNSIYPTVPINGYNDIILCVKEKDEIEAKEIINEYLSKQSKVNDSKPAIKIIPAIEFIIGGTVITNMKDRFKPNFLK